VGAGWTQPLRGRRFDTPVLVAGGLLSGVLGLGVALLLNSWAQTDSSRVGPTAATLDEAFSLLYGAAIGLAVGAASVAFVARRGPRVLSATFAGLLGYAVILAPALLVTAPSDVSSGETLGIAAFAAILLMPAVLAGAAVGAAMSGYRTRGHWPRSPS
jgi:peptidoglycan/LPS O-acetylase OafA/YrhL